VRTQKHVTIAETPEVFLVPCLHVSYALPGLENICAAHAQRQREQKRAEEAVQVLQNTVHMLQLHLDSLRVGGSLAPTSCGPISSVTEMLSEHVAELVQTVRKIQSQEAACQREWERTWARVAGLSGC